MHYSQGCRLDLQRIAPEAIAQIFTFQMRISTGGHSPKEKLPKKSAQRETKIISKHSKISS